MEPDLPEDIFYSSIAELGALLRSRKMSSVDLTEAYLARLEKYGAKFGAVVTITRDLALRELGALPGMRVFPVEATYLAWIDARGLPVPDPAAFFEAAGVGLSDGAEFGAPGFVRLNFGCPRDTLREGLQRMAGAVRAL